MTMINTYISILPVICLSSGLIMFMYRRKLSHLIWNLKRKYIMKAPKEIHLISEKHQWNQISDSFIRSSRAVSAIGVDCEWIQMKGKRHPIALLQVAAHSGLCVLFRLNILNDVPDSLKELLRDENVYKVGVGTDIDASYLMSDYGIEIRSWVDLRHLAIRSSLLPSLESEADTYSERLGLDSLTQKYLGKKLNKKFHIRTSNWEADALDDEQVHYAAEDALSGIQILLNLLTHLGDSTPNDDYPPLSNSLWEAMTSQAIRAICRPFAQIKFSKKHNGTNHSSSPKRSNDNPMTPKNPYRSYSTRRTPLYHNSQLCAPDGEPLCVCDPKKAVWYVEKGLGEYISEEPMVVRLKFEPAGRPIKEGTDGEFYLQERLNKCVVCGKEDSYIRKNIIPHEYRKYFPKTIKAHQSHDVLLLCVLCHQTSNIRDNVLRTELAQEFDAPIGTETDVKFKEDTELKVIKSAGRVLTHHIHLLPPERKLEKISILKKYFDVEDLSEELIKKAATIDVHLLNKEYVPHGYKVYLHYKKVGLNQLEQRWRKWFLDSMEPQYLPDNWSISHNFNKLQMKMSRYSTDHPIWHELKEALVGTEGCIDQDGSIFKNGNA